MAVCAVCRLATQDAAIVAFSYEAKKCAHGVFGQLAKCTPQRRCLATITDVTRQRGPRCKSGSSTHGRLRAASRPSGEMRNAPVSSGRCQVKKFGTLLDLCVSSLRRGHANLLCIVPILPDVPRRESSMCCELRKRHMATPTPKRGTLLRLCVSSLRRAMPIFSVSLQFYRMLLKRL